MLLSNIVKLVNSQLAGEQLTYKNVIPHLDFAIDAINANMNTIYPTFSDLSDTDTEYTAFPDRYIRQVVVPGAAWHYYVMDEEDAQTAMQFKMDFENGKFQMLRDMIYSIPEEYVDDENQGTTHSNIDSRTFGYEGVEIDVNDFRI